jgi:3-oxoacyl-[acyl-carrier protein] reductase
VNTDAQNEQGVAVITGAAGGMGSHIARRLHADGRKVLLTDIDDAKVEGLAAELSPDGSTAHGIRLDVSQHDDFLAGLQVCQQLWGNPTILVNNAALIQEADVFTLEAAEFNRVLTTNVDSVFFGCQVFGAAMAEQGYGRIVNMASLAGQNGGTATGAHYAASKGAILTVTKIFAKQLADQGVTVNAIAPGPHDVPVVKATVSAERLNAVISSIPVGRLGNPAFVADVVALLSDDNAYFVTGACWDVNGGLHLR